MKTGIASLGPLRGRTDGLDPAAGDVGEYLTAVRSVGAPLSLTTNVPATLVSLSQTAGHWLTWGAGGFLPSGTAAVTLWSISISEVDNTTPNQDDGTRTDIVCASVTPAANVGCRLPAGPRRKTTNAAFTSYLIGAATFTSTMTGYGRLQALRLP